MIRHFCDICDKVLEPNDTNRPRELQWYKLSKVIYSFSKSGVIEAETTSTEICNTCLKAIVDEAKRRGEI